MMWGMYSPDEKAVLDYLKTSPHAFFAAREICRRAAGKAQWEENRYWAIPVLDRLLVAGRVETDAANHFRILDENF